MATVLKPPAPLLWPADARTLFLAGSIEMGAAPPWQDEVERSLSDDDTLVVLNPRRDDWDASWPQSPADARFRGQVEWELEAQERADLIVMYFAPTTRAPITLLELGLAARGGRLVVCCPDGFWRQGNVQIVCERYGVPVVDDLTALVASARAKLARG
ncbi:MAG: hypothetical protein EOO75_06150 [Myxococcales bacterium]|nr:MAG: hypothetical protein EOO75_06150 [Myxococcales bacterium]